MVLDPFSALGLAGNIVQFVDFASKLVSKSVKLYRSSSGESTEYTLEQVTYDLHNLSDGLAIQYSSSGPGADKDIANVARACKLEAEKLSAALAKVRTKHGSRLVQSIHQALAEVWRKNEIEEFRINIAQLQTQLLLYLVKLISDRQSSFGNDMKELGDESLKMNINTSAQLDRLTSTMDELRNFIVQKVNTDLDTAHKRKKAKEQKSDDEPAQLKLTADYVKLLRELGIENGKEGGAVDVPYNPIQLKKISDTLRNVISSGSTLVFEQEILRSLKFEDMRMRESNITRAHLKTFDWIMESWSSTEDATSRNQFLHWLCHERGIFWVSGKPGSGKSTLMKYLVNHPNMKQHLQTWARNQTLVTGNFFFWNAGKPMQKSQQGLLQSLLFEVLRQCPFLIETTFPKRWAEWQGEKAGRQVLPDWTVDDLKAGFKQLMHADIQNAKFCFFIDGLDEYEGYSSDITETLDDLTTSSNIKLCLSSRPWAAFQTAYGDPARSLKLQDLTRDDIRLYVREKLEEHKSFVVLKNEDPRHAALVEEIVDKAEGVFLWVVLVVQSLREGIVNADPISILTKRLRELPSDLDTFFRHILGQVDKVYWAGTTQAFEMAIAGEKQLPLWYQLVLDDESPDRVIQAKIEHVSNAEVEKIHISLEKRLNARCKGLLEAVTTTSYPHILSKKKVDFLHRTVRDFLRLGDIKALLAQRLEMPFDPNFAICTALLAQAKAVSAFETSLVEGIYHDFLLYSTRVITFPTQGKVSSELLLDLIASLEKTNQPSRTNPSLASLSLHPLVVQKCYIHYMEQAVAGATRQLLSRQATERLEVALLPSEATVSLNEYMNPILVHLILEDGGDPNHEVEDGRGGTIWTRFLELLDQHPSPRIEEQFQIVEKMIFHQADLDALVKVGHQNIHAEAVVSEMFRGKQAVKLKQSMRDSRKVSKRSGSFSNKSPPPNPMSKQARPQNAPSLKSELKGGIGGKTGISRSLWRTKLFGK